MINNRQHNITQSSALVVGKCEQYLIFTSSCEIGHYIVSSVFFYLNYWYTPDIYEIKYLIICNRE